jgi:hypothetical protein
VYVERERETESERKIVDQSCKKGPFLKAPVDLQKKAPKHRAHITWFSQLRNGASQRGGGLQLQSQERQDLRALFIIINKKNM